MNRTGEQGSIVIEAMIAAAVIAAMLGAVFESIQSASLTTRLLASRREAILVAQSTMALVGVVIPVVPGATDGVSGALAWRVDIRPSEGDGPSSAGTLDLVTVTVAAPGGGRLATLRTARLGR